MSGLMILTARRMYASRSGIPASPGDAVIIYQKLLTDQNEERGLGFESRRGAYLAVLVVALAGAILLYNNFLTKPTLEVTGIIWRRSGGFAGLEETLTVEINGSVALTSSFLGDSEFTISS